MNPVNLNFPCPESICGFPVPTHMVYHLCILSRKTIQTMTTTNTSFSYLFLPFPLSYALSQILFFLITSSLIYLFILCKDTTPSLAKHTDTPLCLLISHPCFRVPFKFYLYKASFFVFVFLCLKDIFNNY